MYRARLKKLLLIIAVAIIPIATISFSTEPVYAIDERFFSLNDILYYNPDDTGLCPSTTSGTTALSGSNNLEKIYNYMIGKGLSDFQAAGIVGNISQESQGNPLRAQVGPDTQDPSVFGTAVGVGRAWGIIQWDAGGRAIDYAKQAGIAAPIYELSTQLDLVWWHMNNTTPTSAKNFLPALKATTTLEEATLLYEQKMEGAGTPNMPNRYTAAKLALSYVKSGASGVSNTSTCGGSGSGAAVGNAVQTAINYAWPEYHSPPYTVLKPSYAQAVAAAQAAGKYVGGGINPGVDCGGFVTRVMQDSGVDPAYNQANGPTVSQLNYALSSGKYTEIKPTSTADMMPGDIAINSTHTYMYVGQNPGFATDIASASYSTTGASWRSPMAGHEKPADPNFRWFRLK